jgi:hypothetical protein
MKIEGGSCCQKREIEAAGRWMVGKVFGSSSVRLVGDWLTILFDCYAMGYE